MTARKRGGVKHRALLVAAGIGLTAVLAGAVLITKREFSDDSTRQADESELITTPVERQRIAEYLEITGSLDYAELTTLTSQSNGVLVHLAPEGTVVRRGEQLYQIVHEPTEAETADVLARLASARNSLVTARKELEDALSGPSEADVKAARAAVADARETRDNLRASPTAAEIVRAEAETATAAADLDTLLNPSEAALSEARSRLTTAEADLTDLQTGPSKADIDSAQAMVLTAKADLTDLQTGPSKADIDSAQAMVLTAKANLTDLQTGPSKADIDSAQAMVLTAKADLTDLQTGPSKADIDSAQAMVLTAKADLTDLQTGPSKGEIESAQAMVLTAEDEFYVISNYYSYTPDYPDLRAAQAELYLAEEALAVLLAGPSEAELNTAKASLLSAEEALAALLAGPSEAELNTAKASLLSAEEALAALLAGPSEAELNTAKASLLSAEETLAVLLAGPSEAELNTAKASLLSAEETLAVLLAGPSEAELNTAKASVHTAAEVLETLENPTESALLTARADLATAQEALDELLTGPTAAAVDTAESAVLTTQEVLDELLAGYSPADIEAFESTATSAEAAVVSAEADLAALNAGHVSRFVMYGSTPVYRTMTVGMSGEDIRQLEQNLAELGYDDTDGIAADDTDEFAVDGDFDEATTAAVRWWQEAVGLDPDGTVGMTDILFVNGPVQIGSWSQGIELGGEVTTEAALAALTVIQAPIDGEMVTTQRVIASLPLSDRDLVSEGITVNVELPDGTDIAGTVADISPFPVLDATSGENAVEVTILPVEPALEVWIGATVDVEITETLIDDALVVPATALLALVEGGYAVEVLDPDGAARLIGVEVGLFTDGDVEVQSDELVPGMRVVVPR